MGFGGSQGGASAAASRSTADARNKPDVAMFFPPPRHARAQNNPGSPWQPAPWHRRREAGRLRPSLATGAPRCCQEPRWGWAGWAALVFLPAPPDPSSCAERRVPRRRMALGQSSPSRNPPMLLETGGFKIKKHFFYFSLKKKGKKKNQPRPSGVCC